jgi:hypothetical protein
MGGLRSKQDVKSVYLKWFVVLIRECFHLDSELWTER